MEAVAAAPVPGAPTGSRAALIIDGAYAYIGARHQEGRKLDFVKLRGVLEELNAMPFRDCWYFDQEPVSHRYQGMAQYYNFLKLAPPRGPQFQLMLYPMKKYRCHCQKCGNDFFQNVQKGVDNGIATKMLSLAFGNVLSALMFCSHHSAFAPLCYYLRVCVRSWICERFILLAGDGDFYDSLNHIRNVLQKDIWVVGYRNSLSADLQQLASRVVWLDEIWKQVCYERPPRPEVPGDHLSRDRSPSPPVNGRRRTPDRVVSVSHNANYPPHVRARRPSRDQRNGFMNGAGPNGTVARPADRNPRSSPDDSWMAAGSIEDPKPPRVQPTPSRNANKQKRKRDNSASSSNESYDGVKSEPDTTPASKRPTTPSNEASQAPTNSHAYIFTMSDVSGEEEEEDEDLPLPTSSRGATGGDSATASDSGTAGDSATTAIDLAGDDTESD